MSAGFAMAGLALTFALSAAQAQTKDLTAEQAVIAEVEAPKSELIVTGWINKTDDNYKIGDTLDLSVKTNMDAYITIVDVATSGKVHILFPNKFQTDNHVLAHQVLQIPGVEANWRIKVGGPPGQEVIKVIATLKPDAVIDMAALEDVGPIYKYRSTAQALSRSLSAEINTTHAGTSATFQKMFRILPENSGFSQPTRQTAVKPASKTAAPVMVVSPSDLFKLGENSFYGDGGRANHREALKYFTSAADGGHVGAMYFIGRIHEAGADVDASLPNAVTWYRRAADLGNTQAMVRLAMLHSKTEGANRDMTEPMRWLRKAAGQGDTMAMIHLARMHDEGINVDRTPKDAAKYLLSALKGGAWTVVDQLPKFSEDTRREVQNALVAAGHYRGPVEGRVGADTRAAMVEWAKAG